MRRVSGIKALVIYGIIGACLGVAMITFALVYDDKPTPPCQEAFDYLDEIGGINDVKLLSWYGDRCLGDG